MTTHQLSTSTNDPTPAPRAMTCPRRWFFAAMCVRSLLTGSFLGAIGVPPVEAMTGLVFVLGLYVLLHRSRRNEGAEQ